MEQSAHNAGDVSPSTTRSEGPLPGRSTHELSLGGVATGDESIPIENAHTLAARNSFIPGASTTTDDPASAGVPMARDRTVISRGEAANPVDTQGASPLSDTSNPLSNRPRQASHEDEVPKASGAEEGPKSTESEYTKQEDDGRRNPSPYHGTLEQDSVDILAPTSRTSNPAHQHTPWIDLAQQTVIGPSSAGTISARPTSVPIMQDRSSHPLTHTDRVERPHYPDQSYKALESQRHPPSYHPPPLRTRNSNPSQHSSYSSLSSRKSREFPSMIAGAKTVGSTPAQSPGLYSPSYPRSKASTEDLEDIGYQTPQLHPTHNQTPIETHKLEKDIDPVSGNKCINNYQIIKRLGNGQHGTVKLARNIDTKEEVAVKIVRRIAKRSFRKVAHPNEMIRKEVAILKKARHPHVVSLLEVIDDSEFKKVYLILEFVALGEIVWRKQTVKDVAVFEMHRVHREKTGVVNPEYEIAEIENFNQTAIARRGDKARVVRERKQGVGQAIEPGHWSLEFGTASEDGQGSDHGQPFEDQGEQTGTEQDESNETQGQLLHCEGMGVHEGRLRASESSESILSNTPKASPWTAQLDEPPLCSSLTDGHKTSPEGLRPHDRQATASDTKLRTMITDFIDTEKEWTPQEDEYRYVACLTISQARDAFRDTVLGLEYLHYQGIIHRDIKPANLLWTAEQRVKISDFGVSYLGKPIRDDDDPVEVSEDESEILDEAIELAKTRGTPAFYAPELCDPDLFDEQKTPVRPQITGQIDVWSLGVTLYCMIFGRLPFIDESEMAMYEKIAHEEVFIPHVRLKAVEDSARAPMGSHKRLDDLVEYEDVGDELADLIRRLLDKDPTRRITLKEVKHHPWVLQGIQDQASWVEETDPSVQSQGKKIEVSNEEVDDAVVGLSIRDFVKSSWKRTISVLGRGRDHRRGDRSAKSTDSSHSMSTSKTDSTGQESRRASLRDVDMIPQALRASRDKEASEHPLAQSQNASQEDIKRYDELDKPTEARGQILVLGKPSTGLDRTTSNADSVHTIRPPTSGFGSASNRSSSELITSLTSTILDSSTSGFHNILGGRFLRSRERGSGRDSPSRSSRASSVDLSAQPADDRHGSASIALSSASASGLMDPPPALRDDVPQISPQASVTSSPSRPGTSTDLNSELLQHSAGGTIKNELLKRATHNSTGSLTPEAETNPTPPNTTLYPLRSHSEEELREHVEVSSSSEQIASGCISDQFSHPSMPSITSGASSPSITDQPGTLPKMVLTSVEPDQRVDQRMSGSSLGVESSPIVLNESDAQAPNTSKAEEDDAGYNGGGEQDSDSDDDGGLTMS